MALLGGCGDDPPITLSIPKQEGKAFDPVALAADERIPLQASNQSFAGVKLPWGVKEVLVKGNIRFYEIYASFERVSHFFSPQLQTTNMIKREKFVEFKDVAKGSHTIDVVIKASHKYGFTGIEIEERKSGGAATPIDIDELNRRAKEEAAHAK